jgi:hypothetical protein
MGLKPKASCYGIHLMETSGKKAVGSRQSAVGSDEPAALQPSRITARVSAPASRSGAMLLYSGIECGSKLLPFTRFAFPVAR